MKIQFVNKTQLKKINRELEAGGYSPDSGDATTAEPAGCGAGYTSNIVDRAAGADPDARKEVERIIERVLNN